MEAELRVSCVPFLEFAFPLADRFEGSDWLAEAKNPEERTEKKTLSVAIEGG